MAQESTLPDMHSVRKQNSLEGKRLQHTLDKISQAQDRRVKKIQDQIRQASHESYQQEIDKENRARQLLATYVKIRQRRYFVDKWRDAAEEQREDNSTERRASQAAVIPLEKEKKSSLTVLPASDGRNSQLSNLSPGRDRRLSFASLSSPKKERRNSQVTFATSGRDSRASFVTLPSPSKEQRTSQLTLPPLGRESRRSFRTLLSAGRESSRQSRQTLTPFEQQRGSVQFGLSSSERPERKQSLSLPPIQQDRRRSLFSSASDRRSSKQSSIRPDALERIDSILTGYEPGKGPLPKVYVMQTFPYVYHSDGVKDCPRYTVFFEHKDRRKIAVKTRGRRKSTYVSKDDWALINSNQKRLSTQSLPPKSGSPRKLQMAAKMKMALAKLRVIRM